MASFLMKKYIKYHNDTRRLLTKEVKFVFSLLKLDQL